MCLPLKNNIILEMFIPPSHTEYFTVNSGPEMDLAPVIAIKFICCKFFLCFSSLSRGFRPITDKFNNIHEKASFLSETEHWRKWMFSKLIKHNYHSKDL